MIISSVFRSNINRENIQQRILGYMSISHVIFVSLRLTGFIWAPREWKQGNLGNKYTCDVQGFIFGVAWGATASYNCTLALYYLLVIKYNWKPTQLKKIQKYFFIIPMVAGIPGSIYAIIFDIFNIRSNPYDSCFGGPDTVPLMSEGFEKYYLYIGTCALSGIIVFNLTCMALVCQHVRKVEKNSLQECSSNDEVLQRTKVVQTQFELFTLAFLTTSLFQVISKVIAFIDEEVPVALNTLSLVLMNASGLLNALVYFRLRYNRIRKEYPDCQRVHILVNILKDTLLPSFAPSCCGRKGEFTYEDLEPTLYNTEYLNGGDGIEEQKEPPLRLKDRADHAMQALKGTEDKSFCRSEKNGTGSSTAATTNSTTSYLDESKKKMNVEPRNLQRNSSMREDWRALKAAGVQTSNSTLKSNENSIDAQKPKSLRSIPDIDDDKQQEEGEEDAWVDLSELHTESMSKREILRTSMREDWRALKAAGVQTSNTTLKSNESTKMDKETSKK